MPARCATRIVVGLDLSDKTAHCVMLDTTTGEVLEDGTVRLTKPALQRKFASGERMRVALEAGTHSAWVSRLLEEAGHEVIVANPRKVGLIAKNHTKDDRVDAMLLARLAAADPALLHPIDHRTAEGQRQLEVIRARDLCVRERTALINHVRTAVKAAGHRLPKADAHYFARHARPEIPEELQVALLPLLEVVEALSERIKAFDREVERIAAEERPEAMRLRQVAGVGPLTSLVFVLVLQDPGRFRTNRDVGAYLGLVPKRRDSGAVSRDLGISKCGDGLLRRLLVQSAHYVLGRHGPDSDLRRWGLALAERKDKRVALAAVARKLAVLLHSLWLTGEAYEPLRNSRGACEGGKTADGNCAGEEAA